MKVATGCAQVVAKGRGLTHEGTYGSLGGGLPTTRQFKVGTRGSIVPVTEENREEGLQVTRGTRA